MDPETLAHLKLWWEGPDWLVMSKDIPELVNLNSIRPSETHWHLIKKLRDKFWTRWAREYVHTLQQRSKWTQQHANLQPGDLVLIVDSSLIKTNRWPLGRIDDVYSGPDGFVRTAKFRTTLGTYDRPIHKLCRLPVSQNEQN